MSTLVGITTFLVIRDSRNRVQHRFQNSEVGRTLLKKDTNPDRRVSVSSANRSYNYLSFIYLGSIMQVVAYDPEIIEITLSSSIDAVGVSAPHKILTTEMVGALPVSAQIQNI